MTKLRINMATSDYDHTRDIALGRVEVEGIDLNYLNLTIEEIFYRFTLNREWEVSEMSMAKFVAQVAGDRPDILGIPVFPSRVFRLSNIYVLRGSDIKSPEQLVGKKMGTPEWAQTASVYTRGWLVDDVGIDLADIDWHQAGVNQPGRVEKVKIKLPKGVKLTPRPETCLEELLLTGGVDAIMSAHPPDAFVAGNPDIVRLYPDYQAAEEEYYKRTKIFPIMHIIAIQTRVLDENPWVARNLLTAFNEARALSMHRVTEMTASRFLVPWLGSTVVERQELLGDDYFPYGIEHNRTTLEAFLRWSFEQGVAMKHLKVEELFPKSVQGTFKV